MRREAQVDTGNEAGRLFSWGRWACSRRGRDRKPLGLALGICDPASVGPAHGSGRTYVGNLDAVVLRCCPNGCANFHHNNHGGGLLSPTSSPDSGTIPHAGISQALNENGAWLSFPPASARNYPWA